MILLCYISILIVVSPLLFIFSCPARIEGTLSFSDCRFDWRVMVGCIKSGGIVVLLFRFSAEFCLRYDRLSPFLDISLKNRP